MLFTGNYYTRRAGDPRQQKETGKYIYLTHNELSIIIIISILFPIGIKYITLYTKKCPADLHRHLHKDLYLQGNNKKHDNNKQR